VPSRHRGLGRAPDPGPHGVLLLELEPRSRRRLLPEPGGRDRVAPPAQLLAGAPRSEPCPGQPGARRGGAPGPRPPRRRLLRLLRGPDRRLLRAHRDRPAPLEGVRGRRGGLARHRGVLRAPARTEPRAARRGGGMSQIAFTALDAAPVPYAATP